MKCPHCGVEIHAGFETTKVGIHAIGREEPGGAYLHFAVDSMQCPSCERPILRLEGAWANGTVRHKSLIYPRQAMRAAAPEEVPAEIAEDFNEAAVVLGDSAKASAALSRRCLQAVLRDKGFPQHDLARQIDAVLAAKVLPSSLAENVDAIRNTGNFAAHPMKNTNSGQILPVEPHEAEWNLEVLEGLFDFVYVAPARDAARKAAFNAKLAAAGKPPMK